MINPKQIHKGLWVLGDNEMASPTVDKTKNKFGVPVVAGEQGILMPKLKFRFRVSMLDGFGGDQSTRRSHKML